jgi:hypothetical protein
VKRTPGKTPEARNKYWTKIIEAARKYPEGITALSLYDLNAALDFLDKCPTWQLNRKSPPFGCSDTRIT